MARLSRAKACGANPPCHIIRRIARVTAWQLGHAKACGVTLQGVTPRNLTLPKGTSRNLLIYDDYLMTFTYFVMKHSLSMTKF